MMMMDYGRATCDIKELFDLFAKIKVVPSYDDSNVRLLIADLFHGLRPLGGMKWWIKTDDGLYTCEADVCKTNYLGSTEYSIILQGGFAGWLKVSQKKFPVLKELATIFGTADVHLLIRVNFDDEFFQCKVNVDSPCEGFDTELVVKRLNPLYFDLSFFESSYETEFSLRVRLAATDDQDKILFVGRNKNLFEMIGGDHVLLTDTDKSLASIANISDVCFNRHIEKYLKENEGFCVVEPQG